MMIFERKGKDFQPLLLRETNETREHFAEEERKAARMRILLKKKEVLQNAFSHENES